jgi:hypothetical protein
MINLQVDEAYAFDYLTILEVKKDLFPDSPKIIGYENCYKFLSDQLPNFNDIVNSKEYRSLYESNKITFDLVDKARNNLNVTAKEVDDANMDRFYCKQALQKAFFSTALVESKIV